MKIYNKAILPIGFKANGIACGIKKSGKLDLALFYSDIPAKAGCKFTTNKILAAPILVDKMHLEKTGGFRAIIANSGNANCFTGSRGLKCAKWTAQALSKDLSIGRESVLIASTGIIARQLPLDKISKGMPELISGLSAKGIDKAKRAIMTTDKFAKEVTAKLNVAGKVVTICGVAKGAGMIAPSMATLLVFIFTDANISQAALDKSVRIAVDNSFNCITVDGCMSTNDSVMLLANGASGNILISNGSSFNLFTKALNRVCLELAKMVIRDAEGATKFIKIKVGGARNFTDAKRVALSIANSNLFKTAAFASSLNILGRIAAGAGASGVPMKEKDLKIKFSSLRKSDISIDVAIGKGKGSAVIYTSDLSYEYVKINAEYN
jgi:glutamate N-acetyltransferase/amino-acid N-acetyltransferase